MNKKSKQKFGFFVCLYVFCFVLFFVLVAVIVLTVPSCIDFIDHNYMFISLITTVCCMVAQFGFSAQMGKHKTQWTL